MRVERSSHSLQIESIPFASHSRPSFPDTISKGTTHSFCSLIANFFSWLWNVLARLFCWDRDTIAIETKDLLDQGEYVCKGVKCLISTSLKYSAEQSKEYSPQVMKQCYPLVFATIISVTIEDPIDIALENTDSVLIDHREEGDLFRRTGIGYVQKENHKWFPLRKNSVVFSPKIPVIRHAGYQFMEKPQFLSIIISDPEKEKQRIYNELFAAMEHECKHVVIALEGKVPPEAYLTLLQKFFAGTFEKVTFAILCKDRFNIYKKAIEQIHGKIDFKKERPTR